MAQRMSGPQKAAILLLTLGEEAAAEVLKNLSEAEIQEVSRYMAHYSEVTPQDVDRVANEFYLIAERGRFLPGPPTTKVEYLRKILGRAIGEERAGEMVDGLVARKADGPLEQLKWHDPNTIAGFLADEHPQVIAVILANMGDPPLARSVIEALPGAMQQDIFTRLARLRSIPDEWLEEIEASLSEEMAAPRPTAGGGEGGEQRVAEVLGAAEAPVEEALIEHLQRRNPELAERIRQRLFAFSDLLKIDNYGIQLVLKRISGRDLVLALKLADEPVKRHLLRNMAAQSAERFEQAVASLGPTPVAQIEAAQKRIARTARILIEGGEIFPLERRRKSPEA